MKPYIPSCSSLIVLTIFLSPMSSVFPLLANTNSVAYSALTPDEMIAIHDQIEQELLMRFDRQRKEQSRGISKTMEALCHIQSQQGMEKLLAEIDIQPEAFKTRGGDFDSVAPSGAWSLQRQYPAFRLLESKLTPSVGRIILEAESAEPGSKRETLIILLGYSCYESIFSQYAKERNIKKPAATDWSSIYGRFRYHLEHKK